VSAPSAPPPPAPLPPVVVLAGGFGTRLRAAVPDLPKPLAPASGRPFLAWLVEALAAEGARRIVLSVGYRAEAIAEWAAAQGAAGGPPLEVVAEEEPLGTGGAALFAARRAGLGEFLVMNGDTWLGAFVRPFAGGAGPALGVLRIDEDTGRYGRVELAGGRVAAFAEKQPGAGPGWISTGVARLDRDELERRAAGRRRFSLEEEVHRPLAAEGRLAAVELPGPFVDIGIPEDWRRFGEWAAAGRLGAARA